MARTIQASKGQKTYGRVKSPSSSSSSARPQARSSVGARTKNKPSSSAPRRTARRKGEADEISNADDGDNGDNGKNDNNEETVLEPARLVLINAKSFDWFDLSNQLKLQNDKPKTHAKQTHLLGLSGTELRELFYKAVLPRLRSGNLNIPLGRAETPSEVGPSKQDSSFTIEDDGNQASLPGSPQVSAIGTASPEVPIVEDEIGFRLDEMEESQLEIPVLTQIAGDDNEHNAKGDIKDDNSQGNTASSENSTKEPVDRITRRRSTSRIADHGGQNDEGTSSNRAVNGMVTGNGAKSSHEDEKSIMMKADPKAMLRSQVQKQKPNKKVVVVKIGGSSEDEHDE
ncbi:uncharacterized protein I303_103776 [Kwoniella dejecticola CBS 10117]|uniref:Uncharacterized protein n=1 Tax=Kwoniella dejecticola CBS 10117 TaxID=1296121 RepID=A0A1A6A7P3_9TREE|nr:uncharacterized protein I303_03794 [Kwoniella dejecticola CBS 10117]OBR86076.1 hypothetical protein I303_03794 [Kwoniella dejecticola CBS 10117]